MTFSIGTRLKISVFGSSHGPCVGAIVEGVPAGQAIDAGLIQKDLDRRRPGQSELVSPRKEVDKLEILGGVRDSKATGAPITMIVRNRDVNSGHYDEMKDMPRPGHADLTARIKYNGMNDQRGGGVFSGRMTAAFVMAGAIAKQMLAEKGVSVNARALEISGAKEAKAMEKEILKAREEGDSVGGIIECVATDLPAGIGEPLFDSVESIISHLIFSMPAVKGIEFGSGFKCAGMKGSEHNDAIVIHNGKIATETNNAGGILGGITNGMPVVFRVAIKPTPSIAKKQKTVNLKEMKECELSVKGRHDPCVVIRAVPVVESLAAIGLADLVLRGCR